MKVPTAGMTRVLLVELVALYLEGRTVTTTNSSSSNMLCSSVVLRWCGGSAGLQGCQHMVRTLIDVEHDGDVDDTTDRCAETERQQHLQHPHRHHHHYHRPWHAVMPFQWWTAVQYLSLTWVGVMLLPDSR